MLQKLEIRGRMENYYNILQNIYVWKRSLIVFYFDDIYQVPEINIGDINDLIRSPELSKYSDFDIIDPILKEA